MVEYLVRNGQQVFVISWRIPRPPPRLGPGQLRHRGARCPRQVERICGTGRTAVMGVCAGGIIASVMAAHLAAAGQQDRLACFSLLVTVLDTANAGTVAALADRQLAAAKAMSARRGYLDGRALAEAFAWLRPGDLVWNYWVNIYLLGKTPPAFDILSWNADTTRMSARLHADFVDLAMDNKLVTPGQLTVLGIPVDLSQVGADSYIVAGIADHITRPARPTRPARRTG
jgi:polyhydroxyalkanoate synthase